MSTPSIPPSQPKLISSQTPVARDRWEEGRERLRKRGRFDSESFYGSALPDVALNMYAVLLGAKLTPEQERKVVEGLVNLGLGRAPDTNVLNPDRGHIPDRQWASLLARAGFYSDEARTKNGEYLGDVVTDLHETVNRLSDSGSFWMCALQEFSAAADIETAAYTKPKNKITVRPRGVQQTEPPMM